MITILKNTLIIYIGLLGLNQDYHLQCPQQVIAILSDFSFISIINEIRMMLIPIIKKLPLQWITILIWSSLIMTSSLIILLMYLTAKFAYNLFMNLVIKIIISLITRELQIQNIVKEKKMIQ